MGTPQPWTAFITLRTFKDSPHMYKHTYPGADTGFRGEGGKVIGKSSPPTHHNHTPPPQGRAPAALQLLHFLKVTKHSIIATTDSECKCLFS